jgi:acyl-homoserine lactone acylase PvdQ
MKNFTKVAGFGLLLMLAAAGAFSSPAEAQVPPAVVPIVVDTAVPIIVNAVKPKPKPSGLTKFQGYVQHANIAQITVRAKGNDLAIQTFSLSEAAAAKMQQIIDKGGYQWGDKVTIYYDPATLKAIKFKGKPSKPV